MITTQVSDVPGSCGIGTFYDFENSSVSGGYYSRDLATTEPEGGAGWEIVGFINTKECHQAYDILKERFKIRTQTPKRWNSNSGNRFFAVMYDSTKPGGTSNEKKQWPFSKDNDGKDFQDEGW